MNITAFDLYLFGLTDKMNIALEVLSVLCLFLFVGFLMSCFDYPKNKRIVYILGALCVVLSILCVIVPTQKTVAMMYIVPKIANSEFVNKELPKDLKDVYQLALESLKESITKNKKKE